MLRKMLYGTALAVATFGATPNAHSSGIPTFDGAAAAQLILMLQNAVEMLDQVETAKESLEDEYEKIMEVRAEISGLAPLVADLERIATSVEGLDAGVFEHGRDLAAKLASINQAFGLLEPDVLFAGGAPDDRKLKELYTRRLNAARGAMVVSEVAFDTAASDLDDYEEFQTTLGTDAEDLGDLLNLNTRVAIKNGEMLTRLVQLVAATERSKITEATNDLRLSTQNQARIGGFKSNN